jgi:hypothetical protein
VKCELCAECKAKLTGKQLSPEERKSVKEARETHLQQVLKERQAWHRRIEKCKTSDECLAIYLDGMDQDKTDIPRLTTQDVKELTEPMKVRFVFFVISCLN